MRRLPRSLLLSLTGLLLSTPVHGQAVTVGGTVRDSITRVGIDSAVVQFVSNLDPTEQYTVVANQFGNWTLTIQTTGVGPQYTIPSSIRLEQNFPNPFNPSTTINFSIPEAGNVRITVYTILGQQLDSRTAFLESGEYRIDWTATGGAGVLFYSIELNGKTQTRKMVQLDGGRKGGLGVFVASARPTASGSSGKLAIPTFSVSASKLGYESASFDVELSDGMTIDFELVTIHSRAFVFDLHNDVLEKVVDGYQLGVHHAFNQSDLPRFQRGGVDAQMLSVWADPGQFSAAPYARALQMIDSFQVQIQRNPLTFGQARTSAEINQLVGERKFAGVLGVEGGHAIEDDITKLMNLYDLGIRYMTITWNNSTSWATAAPDAQSATKGLSPFGEQVIRTMDSLGIIIDVSHTGIKTIEDILTLTTHPIIASHSGARTLRNHYRNLTDAQIVSIAQTGGVIGVVFYPPFLSATGSADIGTVIDHIDYIRNLVGIDHIAIGSDFDGIEITPVGLEDVSKLPALTLALLKRGYSVGDVRKILGENYLRVFEEVCH
ncbi:MAG: membrane dipeptidase, partial [Ignavibacteria bacterium]|nr:membrane dipeptidase [Ignavibacteria bacterium]